MLSPFHWHSTGLYIITHAEELRWETENEGKCCENKGWLDEEVHNGGKAKESYFKTKMQKRARGESQGGKADASERGRGERRREERT